MQPPHSILRLALLEHAHLSALDLVLPPGLDSNGTARAPLLVDNVTADFSPAGLQVRATLTLTLTPSPKTSLRVPTRGTSGEARARILPNALRSGLPFAPIGSHPKP